MVGKILGHCIKWVFRIAALVVMVAVLGAVSAVFIITRMFTPEHLAAIVSDQLQQMFNRPVVIRSVRLVVFEGLKVSSLRVIDNTNHLGKDFLSSDEVTISYDFLPLLSKQLVIKEVSIDSPVINLVKNEDATWNIQGMFKHDKTRRQSIAGIVLNMDAQAASITNGRVTLRDLTNGYHREFSNVDLKLWDFSFEKEFPVRLSLSAPDPHTVTPPVDLYCEGYLNLAGMNWHDASFTRVNMQAGYGKKQIFLTGGMVDFPAPEIALDADVPALHSGDLAAFGKLPSWFHLQRSHVSARVRINGTQVTAKNVKGKIGLVPFTSDIQADFSRKGKPSYKVYFNSGQFNITQAQDMLAPLLPYSPAGTAQVRFALTGKDGKASLDRLGVGLENAQFKWGGFRFSNAGLELTARENFKTLALKINSGACLAGSRRLSALSGQAEYSSGTLTIPALKGRLQDEGFRLRMDIRDLRSPSRAINLKLDADHIDVPELFGTVRTVAGAVEAGMPGAKRRKPQVFSGQLDWLRNFRERLPQFMPNLTGSVHVGRLTSPFLSARNVYADLQYKGMEPGMKKLDGKVDIVMGPGIIYQLEHMSEKEKALNVAFTPFLVMHRMESAGAFQMGTVLKDVNYQQMAGSFDFKGGEMAMHNFYLSGTVISAAGTGKVGWVSETQNITMCTLFSQTAKAGGLSESMSDASGKPALFFLVEGTMLSPKTTISNPKGCGRMIDDAAKKGVRGDFKTIKSFVKGG